MGPLLGKFCPGRNSREARMQVAQATGESEGWVGVFWARGCVPLGGLCLSSSRERLFARGDAGWLPYTLGSPGYYRGE